MSRDTLRSEALTAGMRELMLVPFGFWLRRANPNLAGADEGSRLAAQELDSGPGCSGCTADGDAAPGVERLRSMVRAPLAPSQSAPAGADGGPPPALAELRRAMAEQLEALGHPNAEPLRWAITGIDPEQGLWLEGIALGPAVPNAAGPHLAGGVNSHAPPLQGPGTPGWDGRMRRPDA